MATPVPDSKKRLVALAAMLAVGFMVTTLVSYFVARDSLERHIADEMLPLTSDNIYSEIQRDLLRPFLISSLMASDTFVRDWALGGEEDSARIQHYLREIQQRYGTITAFFISDHTLNYYHPSGIVKTMDPEDPADAWYFSLRKLANDYDINIDRDTADRSRLAVFTNYRVLDYEGHFIGSTGVGLSVHSVIALIDNYQHRYGRRIYFVDRQGEVTLHGRDSSLPKTLRDRPGLQSLVTQILTTPSSSLIYRDSAGDDVFLNSRLVPEFGWYLMVEQHRDQGKERIALTLVINVLISLGIMAAVLLVAHFTQRGYQRRLVEMATTDKLTGTLNRQAFESLFEHAARAAVRRGSPMSLLAIDLDHFKSINDQFGHQGGDSLLKGVVGLLKEQIRDSDVLCRWGGEEFMLLLEDCSLENALQRAEQLRASVKAFRVRYGREDIGVTISVGVAEYRPRETLSALVNRADGALYSAKREGRDCIRSA
ncbi:MAG: sensor domain-containing diguanylate cyclase [Porticoccaceae bacterium]|nr:sensor domain-containing diguanylate cyclase [Porticoccaceae bacterium]